MLPKAGIVVVDLILGAGQLDRTVSDADVLLGQYPAEDGLRYLNWQPSTDPNHLSPEDLAVTILINSRVGPAAFRSAQDRGPVLDIGKLPDVPLEKTSAGERAQVASFIAAVTDWEGFAASVATKVLHKKRPKLIPILDNEAIFGAYMNPKWPEKLASTDSVYATARIANALEWIWTDLTPGRRTTSRGRHSPRSILYGRGLSCSTWCGGFTSAASSQCSQSHPYRRAVRAANVRMRSPRRVSVAASTCNADGTGKAQVRPSRY